MSFEDIPEDREQSFGCENCGGDITKNSLGVWECNSCDVEIIVEGEDDDVED